MPFSNVGSDITKQRIYESVLSQAITKDSIDWVFKKASEDLMLGKVLNSAFNLGLPLLDTLQTIDNIAANSTAIDAIIADTDVMTFIASKNVAMNAIAANSAAILAIIASSTARSIMISNSTAMTAINANDQGLRIWMLAGTDQLYTDFATKTDITASATAMLAIVASVTARTNIFASSTAMTAINANDQALRIWMLSGTGLNYSDFANVAALTNSSIAMTTIAASSTAMTAVIASSTAMAAVAASNTAMTAVAASSTAMNAVIANSTAMNAVIANSTAMNAVIANSTACDTIRNSSVAYPLFSNPTSKFQTSGTFIVPAGKTCVTAIVVGRGGNGGNGSYNIPAPPAGSPGLAGGYNQGVFSVTPGESISVTIGTTCIFKTISITIGAGKPVQTGKLLKLDGTSPHGAGCYGNGGSEGANELYSGGGGGGGGYSNGANGTGGIYATCSVGAGGAGGAGAVLLIY